MTISTTNQPKNTHKSDTAAFPQGEAASLSDGDDSEFTWRDSWRATAGLNLRTVLASKKAAVSPAA